MGARHQSAINVLRGEQNQRLKARLLRQRKELEAIEARKDKIFAQMQDDHETELKQWNEELDRKKAKLEKWWYLQTETWRKKLERDTGMSFAGEIQPIQWNQSARIEDVGELDGTYGWSSEGIPGVGPSLRAPGLDDQTDYLEIPAVPTVKQYHELGPGIAMGRSMMVL